MPRPITATIHLSALKHNYDIARHHSGSAKVWAVVKANAYGHGLSFALQAFEKADGLALVEVDGAIKIRESGWTKPVLLLEGFFHAPDLPIVQQNQIDVVVHCHEQIDLLEQSYSARTISSVPPLRVHIKVNSGMNRLGFKSTDLGVAYQRLTALAAVRVVGLAMHFANADDAFNPYLPVSQQMHSFDLARAALKGAQLEISLVNSAANLLLKPPIQNDWARIGIMLYGGSPNKSPAADFGLLPAMTLSSELIAIQIVHVGESVGYGSRFVAAKPMRVGVVACGYADGYPRHAADGAPVLVSGVRTSLVGRVSMDMITVDVTDIADAKVGSPVILWGRGLPIDDVARAADTSGYELMCAVAQRVRMLADHGQN
jgi:alanine racemase